MQNHSWIALIVGAETLHNACLQAAKMIKATLPDLIVLHTPHGISLSKSLGIYRGRGASGNALWMGAWEEFKVHVDFDDELSGELLCHFQDAGVDAQGINAFAS